MQLRRRVMDIIGEQRINVTRAVAVGGGDVNGTGLAGERRPNRLLDLLGKLKDRTKALLMLTATPMQVHPVEVWDLLSMLGLPPEWNEAAFLKFCEAVDHPSPSHEDLEFMARMFRATEQRYGATTEQDVKRSGATSG